MTSKDVVRKLTYHKSRSNFTVIYLPDDVVDFTIAAIHERDELRTKLEAEKQRNREWEKVWDKLYDAAKWGPSTPAQFRAEITRLDPRNRKPVQREKIGQEW